MAEGEGIILVPESVLMLCHFVSKFLAKALPVKAEDKRLAIDCDPSRVLRNLGTNEKLKKYMAGGLAYCAT